MATWNATYEAKPTNSDSPTRGDDEIRATRGDTRARMGNEHLTYNDATAGAESEDFRHREGSARAFYESSEPGNAPSGGTLADGYLWVDSDDKTLLIHDGTDYQKLQVTDDSGAVVKTGAQTVAGVKTFSSAPVLTAGVQIGSAGTALLTKIITLTAYSGNVWRATHGLTKANIRGIAPVAYFSANKAGLGGMNYVCSIEDIYVYMVESGLTTDPTAMYALIFYVA